MPKIMKIWDRDNESIALQERIEFMRDVTGGTRHMRKIAKEKGYLPQFPSEDSKDYETRLNITVFEPFTFDATISANGKIFAKKPTLLELPEEFEKHDIINNFDRDGTDIYKFANELNKIQITEGIAFVYTAFPSTKTNIVSLNKQMRPYARIIKGDQIISKRYVVDNGRKVLYQIVISEKINENDGDFGQIGIVQYRRIFIDNAEIKYEVYRKIEEQQKLIEQGIIRISGQTEYAKIPIEPCYAVQKGYMLSVSPFEELGHLNVEHFQKMSDFNMSYHLSGANTPVIIGNIINANPAKDVAEQRQTQVGGASILNLEQGGKFEWVSGSTQLQPMSDHIEKREQRMKAMAFDVVDGGNKTATQIKDERADKEAKLNMIALNLEDCLNATLKNMADFMRIDLKKGRIEINKDFNLTVMPIEDLQTYSNFVTEGKISHETFLKEAQKGERLLTIDSIEDEKELATREFEVE